MLILDFYTSLFVSLLKIKICPSIERQHSAAAISLASNLMDHDIVAALCWRNFPNFMDFEAKLLPVRSGQKKKPLVG